MKRKTSLARLLSWSLLFSLVVIPLRPAAPSGRAEKEQPLIKVLQSDAPKAEKAITCKKLAIYGSQRSCSRPRSAPP